MKNYAFLVASAVVCASAAAFADNVQGDNVFGILPVTSGTEYTIVAVPWCECSTNNNQAIAVSNIVKTANLDVNDMVYVLNSTGNYSAWQLKEGEGGVRYWDSVMQVTSTIFGETENPSTFTVDRGSAIILYRQYPKNNSDPKTFYLFGQVGTTNQLETAITPSTDGTTEAKTLIAPPYHLASGDVTLDANTVTMTPETGDKIFVRKLRSGAPAEYTYDGDEWKMSVAPSYNPSPATPTIPAGAGAWYVTKSQTSGRKIVWENVPTK